MAKPTGPTNIRHPRYDKLKIALFNAVAEWVEDLIESGDESAMEMTAVFQTMTDQAKGES